MEIFDAVKEDFSLTIDENPLLLITLLQAGYKKSDFHEKLLKLGHKIFYEIDYVPKTEKLPDGIADYILEFKKRLNDPIRQAYLDGLIGIQYPYSKQNLYDWRRSIINSRVRRIFYNSFDSYNRTTYRKNSITFVCIVGLKGSGKSTLLKQLDDEMQVIEIYKELFARKLDIGLPHPKYWSDEPLKLVLNETPFKSNFVFIGSVLRQEEFYFLKQLGNVRIFEVTTKNSLRYRRLLNRGREIETDVIKLIEFDLNRFGFRVNYETNDLGFWLSKSETIINNDVDGLNFKKIINTKLGL